LVDAHRNAMHAMGAYHSPPFWRRPESSLGVGGTHWIPACAVMTKLTILANQVFHYPGRRKTR
jgi:hypothetical protein